MEQSKGLVRNCPEHSSWSNITFSALFGYYSTRHISCTPILALHME